MIGDLFSCRDVTQWPEKLQMELVPFTDLEPMVSHLVKSEIHTFDFSDDNSAKDHFNAVITSGYVSIWRVGVGVRWGEFDGVNRERSRGDGGWCGGDRWGGEMETGVEDIDRGGGC